MCVPVINILRRTDYSCKMKRFNRQNKLKLQETKATKGFHKINLEKYLTILVSPVPSEKRELFFIMGRSFALLLLFSRRTLQFSQLYPCWFFYTRVTVQNMSHESKTLVNTLAKIQYNVIHSEIDKMFINHVVIVQMLGISNYGSSLDGLF